MMRDTITYVRDFLHAKLCYQLFITPIHLPIEKKYRDFAKMACEFLEGKRSEVIHQEYPRHYVIHRFSASHNACGKKILIAHGWVSRAAYMVRLIRSLQQQGYDVYAVDFPAHGESKGLQLPWVEAVSVLREIVNQHGPFYGVIGHSFGGSMLLNMFNLAGQSSDWYLNNTPPFAVMIASPTQMSTPVSMIARKLKLTGHGYLQLRQLIRKETDIDLHLIRLKHFTNQTPKVNFLCIHGKDDHTVDPKESVHFCNHYKNANLSLLPEADHISVLMDDRVEQLVCNFLKSESL